MYRTTTNVIPSRVLALILTIIATIAAWTLPLYQTTLQLPGESAGSEHRLSLLQTRSQTAGIIGGSLLVLAVLVSVFVKKTQTLIGLGVLLFSILGAMTIGLLYLPSAVALLWPFARSRLR